MTGSILLVLALCVCVGYFGANALFIDWLAALLKGVFGYGYWLAAPALVLTGMILLLHRGRPVLFTCGLRAADPAIWKPWGTRFFVKSL